MQLREIVEVLIRLLRVEAQARGVLLPPNDVLEVTKVPSLVVQGPVVVEEGARRCAVRLLVKQDEPEGYVERLYHLGFDLVATTGDGAGLLDLLEKVARFSGAHGAAGGRRGALNLTFLTCHCGIASAEPVEFTAAVSAVAPF